MPWITFIRDVRNANGDPLYVAGYQADVSEKAALKWVSSGDAKRGQVSVSKPKLVKPITEAKVPAKALGK